MLEFAEKALVKVDPVLFTLSRHIISVLHLSARFSEAQGPLLTSIGVRGKCILGDLH
jgi:hypothetical protein